VDNNIDTWLVEVEQHTFSLRKGWLRSHETLVELMLSWMVVGISQAVEVVRA
jgi:hypothetical protein